MNDITLPPPAPPPADPMPLQDQTRLQRNARGILIVALVALGLWTLHGFLAALIWAAILAVAIGPLYARAERRWPPGRHNILLPLLVSLLIGLLFLLPFIVLGIQAARDAHDLSQFVHHAMESGIPEPALVASLPFGSAQVSDWWKANLDRPSDMTAALRHLTQSSGLSTREIGAAVTHRIVIFFFTLVTLFFLLREWRSLTGDMLRASQKMFGPHGEVVARQVVASIHGTVDGLVLVGIGEGVLLGIAYAVAGVPHATLLGALTAVAAMIPFVIVAMLVVVGALLVSQGAVGAAIAVVVFGVVVNSIADHFVRPGLIGGATKLPFLWVLLGILGGVETWGLIGLFVGPAIMSALILLWREFVRTEPTVGRTARGTTLSPVPIAGE